MIAASPVPLRQVSPLRVRPLSSRLWLNVMLPSSIVMAKATPSGMQRSNEPAFMSMVPESAVSASAVRSTEPAFISTDSSSALAPDRSRVTLPAFVSSAQLTEVATVEAQLARGGVGLDLEGEPDVGGQGDLPLLATLAEREAAALGLDAQRAVARGDLRLGVAGVGGIDVPVGAGAHRDGQVTAVEVELDPCARPEAPVLAGLPVGLAAASDAEALGPAAHQRPAQAADDEPRRERADDRERRAGQR